MSQQTLSCKQMQVRNISVSVSHVTYQDRSSAEESVVQRGSQHLFFISVDTVDNIHRIENFGDIFNAFQGLTE